MRKFKQVTLAGVVAVALLTLATGFTGQAFAQANKVRAAGSTLEVFGATRGPVTVLSTPVKTSTNADLILQVTAECGTAFSDVNQLFTDTDTHISTGFACNSFGFGFGGFGSCNGFGEPVVSATQTPGTATDNDFLMATVEMWVEIDGVAVPVASGDNGRVLFCKLERSTSMIQSALNLSTELRTTESQFHATRTSNSFNWLAKNVGQGTHTVNVKALIKEFSFGSSTHDTNSVTNFLGTTTGGTATVPNAPGVQGVIGKRTLIVEPVSPQK